MGGTPPLGNPGFEWDLLEAAWEEMFAALVAFKAEHGHCNVPAVLPENTTLGMWVGEQRKTQRKAHARMTPARKARLDALGFEWAPLDTVWWEMFAALVAFKAEHGHCNVTHGNIESERLRSWVQTQRVARKKKKLSSDRIARLDALGFSWDPSEMFWEEMFAALVAFKAEHGHCNVPNKWPAHKALGAWVSNQRIALARMTPARKTRLDALGFEWDPFATAWEEMFAALVAFKAEHGHCNVSKRGAEHKSLGIWVSVQRKAQRNALTRMTPARKARLDALGFEWDLLEAAWEEMFAALVAFKAEHGHCNVSQKWPAHEALGGWVSYQRSRWTVMTPARKARLDALGFEWDPLEAAWEEMFAALVAFKAKHGHCNVPRKWPEHEALGVWVSNQRATQGRITPARKALLDALGFEWRRD